MNDNNSLLFGRHNRHATEKQLKYIKILLKNGYISRKDFHFSEEYFRKAKYLTRLRADELIKLGVKRKASETEMKNSGLYA